MAKSIDISTKRIQISKANVQIVIILGVASFVTVFCLIASHAVWGQNAYQSRVIDAKEKAHRQLESNIEAFKELEKSYSQFNQENPNIIAGSKDGVGDSDGDNAKIILDALPSRYDFPALASSLEKLFTDRGIKVGGISGTDDQINQATNTSSAEPKPVDIPFSFSVTNTNYVTVKDLIDSMQRSIRPIYIDSLDVSGSASGMTLTVEAHTQYQPAKNLEIGKQEVK